MAQATKQLDNQIEARQVDSQQYLPSIIAQNILSDPLTYAQVPKLPSLKKGLIAPNDGDFEQHP